MPRFSLRPWFAIAVCVAAFFAVSSIILILIGAGNPNKHEQWKPRAMNDLVGVHNVYEVTPGAYCGSEPEGEPGFRSLAKFGIATVISVDGAKPDAENASKHGLRYVHLPHGYDGISAEQLGGLARALRDLPGPIYLHCHHGKHRGPAAIAAASIILGKISNAQGEKVMEEAGTSPHYIGLRRAVADARPWPRERLDAVKVTFQSQAKVPPLAEAMVHAEHTFDLLVRLSKNRWLGLPEHPDVVAEHEAKILQEHFLEMNRQPDVVARGEEFQRLIARSADLAESLRRDLAKKPTSEAEAAIRGIGRISSACVECHRRYRDVPESLPAKTTTP